MENTNGGVSNATALSLSYFGTVEHADDGATRKDRHSWLSCDEDCEEDDEESVGSGLPLLLIGFVCVMACVAGATVVLIHDAVLYSGCPLGINMCNEFRGKEDKGFFLIKALKNSDLKVIPEWIWYTLSTTFGCFLVATLLTKLPPPLAAQLRGGGTVQALTAAAAGTTIPLPAALLRVLVSCIYLGFGGSLGMEGPCIQVCTSLATLAGWYLGIQSVQTQSLLASLGFSCGFAASFNAPLSGILFALEELQHVTNHMSQSMIGIILLGSALSTSVVRALHGNIHLFEVTWDSAMFDEVAGYSLNKVFGMHMWMLVSIPIGVFSSCVTWGLVTVVRIGHGKLTEAYGNGWTSWRAAFILHGFFTALVGGVVFWLTGLRGIWGVGAESVQEALESTNINTFEYFVFACGKLTALALGVSVRGPGDTLEPVLISGAFFGGFFGKLLLWMNAGVDGAASGAVLKPCVIFGMTGLFASCFRFPLTPIVIVMELTGSEAYSLVLPTILTCFTSNIISNRLCLPLLHEMMRQDGVDLHALAERTRHQSKEADSDGSQDVDKVPSLHGDHARRDRRTMTGMSNGSSLGKSLEVSLQQSGYNRQRNRTKNKDIFKLNNGGFARQTSPSSNNSDRSGMMQKSFRVGSKGTHNFSDNLGDGKHNRFSDKLKILDASELTNDQLMAELSKRMDPQWDKGTKVCDTASKESERAVALTEEELFEKALNDEIHNACGKFILEEDDDDE